VSGTGVQVRYERQQVSAAVRATYITFIFSGFLFANWAARIPQVRDHLHLSPAGLGLVLLAIAVGSLIALPSAGIIVVRLSSRRTVAVMTGVACAGIVVAAIGYLVGIVPVLVGLFLFGFGNGAWDVAMNVQGADVERHLGKAIMPRFHAGWSVGTVGGALLGAAMVALGVPVTIHLTVVAAIVVVVVPLAVREFLPDVHEEHGPASGDIGGHRVSALRRWREPRTVMIGIVVLAFAFSEGAGNDWINVSLIDGYHLPAAIGSLGFALFLAAMTGARWFGTRLLDRFGRVVVVRLLAVVAIAGVLLFCLGSITVLAFIGAFLWGIGTSLGFPVGMSAAADNPRAAAGRVSVVASIGYCAFLAGPPLIGYLGDHITVLKALIAVAVALGVAILLTPAMRPLPAADSEPAVSPPTAETP
jgi:fucose permease